VAGKGGQGTVIETRQRGNNRASPETPAVVSAATRVGRGVEAERRVRPFLEGRTPILVSLNCSGASVALRPCLTNSKVQGIREAELLNCFVFT
jgi:hypothetical protein